jgi:hypothetical protein
MRTCFTIGMCAESDRIALAVPPPTLPAYISATIEPLFCF